MTSSWSRAETSWEYWQESLLRGRSFIKSLRLRAAGLPSSRRYFAALISCASIDHANHALGLGVTESPGAPSRVLHLTDSHGLSDDNSSFRRY